MSEAQKKQNFLQGTALLAMATAIVKVIGALYKIPLNAIIGEQGFSYFNTAYEIYNVLLMISTAGLPVAMSRMISQASSLGISTGMLNEVLAEATSRVQPPSDKGKFLKVYYMTQIGVKPPTFVIFCNNAELFHFSYQRYIENCLRNTFGFKGTPIKLIIRERGED